MEKATGKYGLELINERGDTLVEWATSRKNHEYHVPGESREEMDVENANGVTKTELDYILTNRPDIVTDVTVINQINIGTEHRIVMSNTKLDVEVERTKLMTKRPPRVDATQIGSMN